MSESDHVLTVENLSIAFPTGTGVIQAVDDVSFRLEAGRALGIVGESGSGKSATALALLGLHRGTTARVTGRITVTGTDMLTAPDAEVRRLRGRRVAMVFQDPLSSLDPYYPVGDQIAEVYRHHTGAGRRAARARAIEVLGRVGIPQAAQRVDAHPHEFSGGQRQRALIAMALACEPAMLVADEPTTALDVTVQAQILDLLDGLRAETGMALLLVTHDLGVIAGSADEVLVMRAGRIVERGPVARVLAEPAAAYTRALLSAVPRLDEPRPDVARAAAPRAASDGQRVDGPQADVARAEASRAAPDTPTAAVPRAAPVAGAPAVPAAAEALLSVVDLHRHFAVPGGSGLRRRETLRAVDGVTLDVRRGEALGIVGESGSGKTTLARVMVRLLDATSGRVIFDGEDIGRLPERRLRPLRRDLQMVFQDPVASLNPRRTVGDSVAEPLRVHGVSDDRELRRAVAEQLERVGLDAGHYDRYPHEFSGGQRQRIGIARALVLRPRLLVCDEPVSALDVTTQAQVIALLARLRRELDLTLVFVAHDLAVVRQVSDRVAVMNRGRLVELADTGTIYDDPQDPYTRALLAAIPVLDPDLARAKRRERLAASL
jgi:peptide/nickel transport system ATP-binding protein